MTPPRTKPHLGRTTTPAATPASARTKNRQSKTGRSHSHVPKSRWTSPTAKKVATSLPPLAYNHGPFSVQVQGYDWRFWAIRGDARDTVLMNEIEVVTWDDASAVLTGSVTFREPTWGEKLGLKEGHEIRSEYSEDGGGNYTPCWTMRLDAPNTDLASHAGTMNLVSDLNRLMQSDDDFVYVKGREHPGGWRVDQVIRDICDRYGVEVAYLPVMTTRITNWHLTDQKPLDVIHSALLREKNVTGRKYAVSMDWQKRLWVTPFRRPTSLLEIGPQIIAGTGTAAHDPRFATAVTVRAQTGGSLHLDRKGHRKIAQDKLGVDVQSDTGVSLYGYIHRNVYSPDATNVAKASDEGKLFLAAVAKAKRQFTVTLPGIAWVRRLDAFKVRIPSEGISQIVYVSDARHRLDATAGYTTECVLDFDDPFVDNKALLILNKLSDTATRRGRKLPVGPTTPPKTKTKTQKAHSPGSHLGRTPTPAKPRTTRR